MKQCTYLIQFILLNLLLFSCAAPAKMTDSPQEKLSVVATFSIVSDLVTKVGGEQIVLKTLVATGGDTHTFEPSPNDSVALADAQLIFEIGLGFESWMDELYGASGSNALRIPLSTEIDLIVLEDGDEHTTKETDEHGSVDPHVWHDVANTVKMVEKIRQSLVAADANNAEIYRSNAERYLAELKELDRWVLQEVEKIPASHRKFVTTHDTFGYFAQRYGFSIVGSALGSITTEAAEPAAGEVVALIEQIKREQIPAIFVDTVSNPELMERIASEASVRIAPPLYSDALGESGSAGETYIKMMRHNVTTIVEALRED